MLQLTDEQRQLVIDEHNTYREKVASGGETSGGNGAATNMKALVINLITL